MAKKFVRENVPLSRFGVLVAQLESIVASSAQQSPDSLLCFDLLSDLISSIDEEPKESILLWQRKCEDALYSLLILGARRPVRHLASLAMSRIISKGDGISIYSRASSLQGFLSDGKKSEPLRAAGASQCLGELYRHFGRRITSGLLETTTIAAKLMKFHEDFVRQEALEMLQNALEGSDGNGASAAYAEAFRLIMRVGVGDKSFTIRISAARCLKTFASIGGPGLGVSELENSSSYCVKDPLSSVRDAFAEALGALLALGMNPEAQVQPRGKSQSLPARKLEGGLQKHLVGPFVKAWYEGKLFYSGKLITVIVMDIITTILLWFHENTATSFSIAQKGPFLPVFKWSALEGSENWTYVVLGILSTDLAPNLAYKQPGYCVISTGFLLTKILFDMTVDLSLVNASALRSFVELSLATVGISILQAIRLRYLHPDSELPEFALQAINMLHGTSTVDAHALACVLYILRVGITDQMIETTQRSFLVLLGRELESSDLTASMKVAVLRTLSYILTTLGEVPFEFKGVLDNTIVAALSHSEQLGNSLKVELDSLHGQATVLAALVSISPKLPLGYPARLPQSVLEVSKKMLTEFSRNPVASFVEKEAGWLLLASLIASMPKEELEDQVFDILSLWAPLFGGISDYLLKEGEDLSSEIRVWSAAVDALTSFIKCFIFPNMVDFNNGILLQPVLVYLGRALSYISLLAVKQLSEVKPALDLFIIRILIAYQSLSDPMAYKSDHPQIIQICTTPFRDWFEDELRAFQGGKDGLMPCVWENELSTFPQPETTIKMLVNQMLLCFGILFATQDSGGKLSLLGLIEQCLKSGKKQSWHSASVTNACVGLLAGLKALLALRPQPLGVDILSSVQAIFQGILSEGDICAAQRRASSEGLGLLARLGNDIYTARLTRSLLGDLIGATDSNFTGSIALSLGCIHCSAGGMALSILVPATVSSISLLAKSHNASLQIWSLHGLLLTIEAAGLSFVSQVQATLLLAMEILLSEENGWVDLRQGIGRLINAIVAVLGPELSPGSIFFSRCKSVVAEISSGKETSTLLESVRFTQQLALFAPQAVSMHSHVCTLLPTLSSRQPILRHLAVSTLRHLIEKDPVAIIAQKIEEDLFCMLDEETDPEIGNLVRATITRLLYTSCSSCPSHWISICRNMILATSTTINTRSGNDPPIGSEGDSGIYFGEDDENMVASAQDRKIKLSTTDVLGIDRKRENHLRYRTRVFAAECLSHVPVAVGKEPAHFDLSLARRLSAKGQANSDWLVLHIQELIAIAYQVSTIQFENMQPIGVELLCTIMDKFENIPDPEFPGHFLMEQYQAQLVSAVRTSLDTCSSPLLLEAGLHLATKILTSSIISGDQAAVKRIFSLISRPLNDFKDLYYPSFAEWVACKIKVRLLAAHASVKSYVYAFLRRQNCRVPDEYLALIPQFSQSSSVLGKYWIWILKDYSYTCFHLQDNNISKPFLEGIQSPLVFSKLQRCLEEAWPVLLQAAALDAVPVKHGIDVSSAAVDEIETESTLISGYRMVELETKEYQFLWGLALFILFQGKNSVISRQVIPRIDPELQLSEGLMLEESTLLGSRCCEIALMVLQSLSTEAFFRSGFLTLDRCKELLQVFAHDIQTEHSWTNHVIPVLSQIVQVCPDEFFESEGFGSLAMELCVAYVQKLCQRSGAISHDHHNDEDLVSALFMTLKTLLERYRPQMQVSTMLAFLMTSYNCLRGASTESSFSKAVAFVHNTEPLLKKYIDKIICEGDGLNQLRTFLGAWQNVNATLTQDCIRNIHLLENKKTDVSKLLKKKLSFCLEHTFSLVRLSHESQHLRENKDKNQSLYEVYKHCIRCFKMTLSDFEMQVQTVSLHVLKSLAQTELGEGSQAENYHFFMFFTGEILGDIVHLVLKMIKKPVTRESVAMAGESLRLLVLLQTSSKVGECQKEIMNLLLDIIVIIVSESSEPFSQELNEIRSTALRLVSHLAQIPSSADHFKDVLLAMPVNRREKLQEIIRASVTVDNSSMAKPSLPLIIKIPVQNEQSKKDEYQASAPASSKMLPVESSSDGEEDWDAFQSFPATADANSQMEGISAELNSVDISTNLGRNFDSTDDFQEYSSPQCLRDVKEFSDAQHYESGAETILRGQSEQVDVAELNEASLSEGVFEPSVLHWDGYEEAERNEDHVSQISPEVENVGGREELCGDNSEEDIQHRPLDSEMGGKYHVASNSLPLKTAEEPNVNALSPENGCQRMAKDVDYRNDIYTSEPQRNEDSDAAIHSEHGQDVSEPQCLEDVNLGAHYQHTNTSGPHCIENVDGVTHDEHDLISNEYIIDKGITKKKTDNQNQDDIMSCKAEIKNCDSED
ncbi:hypothetical protein IFM89_024327 [Coptis chinensis]|uniref:HEAT repeat-containing protein 5B n=1 Tax=Coptis chinensis TaxID=261450 RepID=A0A835MFT9_9MAGN|nr:hypothetical protein IFM89_024327 [Coptis chinensis]